MVFLSVVISIMLLLSRFFRVTTSEQTYWDYRTNSLKSGKRPFEWF